MYIGTKLDVYSKPDNEVGYYCEDEAYYWGWGLFDITKSIYVCL